MFRAYLIASYKLCHIILDNAKLVQYTGLRIVTELAETVTK